MHLPTQSAMRSVCSSTEVNLPAPGFALRMQKAVLCAARNAESISRNSLPKLESISAECCAGIEFCNVFTFCDLGYGQNCSDGSISGNYGDDPPGRNPPGSCYLKNQGSLTSPEQISRFPDSPPGDFNPLDRTTLGSGAMKPHRLPACKKCNAVVLTDFLYCKYDVEYPERMSVSAH